MDEAAVAQRLERLDEQVGRLEAIPGATAELALDAIGTLAEVYGEALRRLMALAATYDGLAGRVEADPLLQHLLVLHDVHVAPVEQRVENALASVRRYVESHGGSVELVEVADDVARVRLAGACGSCGGFATTMEATVSDAVLAAAPELARVEPVGMSPAPAVIPVEALLHRPQELV